MTGADIQHFEGRPYVSAEALALLCGVTVAEVTAETERQAGSGRDGRTKLRMPAAWVRAAEANRRRLRTDDLPTLLTLLRVEQDLQSSAER